MYNGSTYDQMSIGAWNQISMGYEKGKLLIGCEFEREYKENGYN